MKEYFFVRKRNNNIRGMYLIEDERAYRLNVKEEVKNCYIQVNLEMDEAIDCYKNENLIDAIYSRDTIYKEHQSLKKHDKLIQPEYKAGIFLERVYRPLFKESMGLRLPNETLTKRIIKESGNYEYYVPRDKETMISSVNQLAILTDELNEIFQTVSASPKNYSSYGHKMRNLLILACTEVEAQLRGILRLHIKSQKKRFSTIDYVKLLPVLKLDKYKIELNYYPNLKTICPFKKWNQTNPTKSLNWYEDYNAIKHDRELEFHRATLINVINSVTAIAVLILAQYGSKLTYWKERVSNFYNIVDEPKWDLQQFYLPPLKGNKWHSIKMNL